MWTAEKLRDPVNILLKVQSNTSLIRLRKPTLHLYDVIAADSAFRIVESLRYAEDVTILGFAKKKFGRNTGRN